MKKALYCTIILLAILAGPGLMFCIPAFADISFSTVSGTVIDGEQYGVLRQFGIVSLMCDTDEITNVNVDTNMSDTIKYRTSGGTVEVYRRSDGTIEINTPSSKNTITWINEQLQVDFNDKSFVFRFKDRPNEILLDLPGDTVRVQYEDIAGNYSITGRQGTVTYKPLDEWRQCSITSPIGTTTYKLIDPANQIQGFQMSGPPPSAHPYRFKAIFIKDPQYNIGLYIDLEAKMHFPPLPSQMVIDNVILYK